MSTHKNIDPVSTTIIMTNLTESERVYGNTDWGIVVAELEGTLLKDPDPFPYFMLVAFERNFGLIRFTILLLLWPLLKLLEFINQPDLRLRIMVLVALSGMKKSEMEVVSRAVLPKFLLDDVDLSAWNVFKSYKRRVVVTRWPRVMVETFATMHLGADEVVGCELQMMPCGYATGLIIPDILIEKRVRALFKGDDAPAVGLGRLEMAKSLMSICKVSAEILLSLFRCFSI
jgi:glycerol-3-phosphate acyltransferase